MAQRLGLACVHHTGRLDSFPPSVRVSRTCYMKAAELLDLDTGGAPDPTEAIIPNLTIGWRKEKASGNQVSVFMGNRILHGQESGCWETMTQTKNICVIHHDVAEMWANWFGLDSTALRGRKNCQICRKVMLKKNSTWAPWGLRPTGPPTAADTPASALLCFSSHQCILFSYHLSLFSPV